MLPQELISWKLPFDHKKTDQSVILAITNGELPNKPEETGDPEVFAALWDFCGLCWLPVENSSRPSADESLGILSGVLCEFTYFIISLGARLNGLGRTSTRI